MKQKYHITIPCSEKKHFLGVLKSLNITPHLFGGMDDGIKNSHFYFVEMSKYELLYVRLACNHGEYRNVTQWQLDQESNVYEVMA